MAETKELSQEELDNALLAWLRLEYGKGLAVLKKERCWGQISKAIAYIDGQHDSRGKALSKVTDNRLRKLALEIAATMTDVRPIWNYETQANENKKQSDTLNKLARAWWRNTKADRRLVSIILYALVGGSGYGLLSYNKELKGGGDLELTPFDPRDVIPIGPVYSDSVQDWRGVILRQKLTLAEVKRLYPSKVGKLMGKETSWSPVSDFKEPAGLISPQWDVLDSKPSNRETPGCDIMRAYMKDDSVNLTEQKVTLGEGEFAYDVYPMGATNAQGKLVTKEMARLYPRGRCVIFTPECILKDIPNPHWHGMYPVVRFTLDALPWSLLGSSIIGDLVPLQDSLNEALRGMDDGLAQWIRRNVAADKRAMPKSALDVLDTRKDGLKMLYNPSAGEPFKLLDGPNPSVFKTYSDHVEFIKTEMEDTGGVRGVTALAQMGQMPSADTMERYMEALSPILRLRSRSMEISLAELAEMLKIGFYQYYSAPRRVELLGKDGLTRDDFDYDPGTMVPMGDPEDGRTRMDRALEHHKLFSFQVAPNSWLNLSHTSKRMQDLQMFRDQMLDPWSLWNSMDVADAGPMPAETIPERIAEARRQGLMQGPPPEQVQLQLQASMLQMQQQIQQMMMMMQNPMPPAAPPMGGGEGPPGPKSEGGRPPTGQVPAHLETRSDEGGARRPVVSESK